MFLCICVVCVCVRLCDDIMLAGIHLRHSLNRDTIGVSCDLIWVYEQLAVVFTSTSYGLCTFSLHAISQDMKTSLFM